MEFIFNILNAWPVLPKKLFNPKKLISISRLFLFFFLGDEFKTRRVYQWLHQGKQEPSLKISNLGMTHPFIWGNLFQKIFLLGNLLGNQIFNNLRISLGLKIRLWTLPIPKKLITFKLSFIKNSIIFFQSSLFLK